MGLSTRKRPTFRVTDDQRRRLDAAAASRGQPVQAFLLEVVMNAVEEVELESSEKRRRRQKNQEGLGDWREVEPDGLMPGRSPTAPAAPTATAPMVVQIGSSAETVDTISMLATYVVSGA